MRQRRLTVMPLAIRPVLELDGCQGIKLLLPGGEVRTKELSLVGSLSEHAFSQLRFDTFVMGICGIDAAAGVTTIRLWPRWLSDKVLVARLRKLKVGLLVGAGKGTRAEVLPLLEHQPDMIAADDPAQLRRTLAEIARTNKGP